jgi:hypothetical protein
LRFGFFRSGDDMLCFEPGVRMRLHRGVRYSKQMLQ